MTTAAASGFDLKKFTVDQFIALTPAQVKLLTPAQIANVTTDQIDAILLDQATVLTS